MIKLLKLVSSTLLKVIDFIFITILTECEKIYPKNADPKIYAVAVLCLYILFILIPFFIYIPILNYLFFFVEKWMFILYGILLGLFFSEVYYNEKRIHRLRQEFKESHNKRRFIYISWALTILVLFIILINLHRI